jgi:protein-tyrosine-phosphatase
MTCLSREVDSAATSRYEVGSSPDRRTIQVCERRLGHGIFRAHVARQISREDFNRA